MKLQAILFDFDGTVIHTERYHKEAIREIWKEHADEHIDDDELRAYTGLTYYERFVHVCAARGIDDDQLIEELEQRAVKRFADYGDLKNIVLPGIQDLLTKLEKQGIIRAIVTSATRERVEDRLKRIHMAEYFEHVTGREDTPISKPHPEPYRWTMEQLHIDPERAVAFEDSPTGIESARLAGLPVVGVLSSFHAQDLEGTVKTIHDYTGLSIEDIDVLL